MNSQADNPARTGPRLAPELISAIINAPGLEVQGDEALVAGLREYLTIFIGELILKAPTRKPLTPREMRKVEALHDKFDALLRSFQSAATPPPMLPAVQYESGQSATPWQRWLYALRFREPGKSEMLNWPAIGELLAIYQLLFGRGVVSEDPYKTDSSQIRFLDAAFTALRSGVASEAIRLAPWYYQVPQISTLNKRLEELRDNEILFASARIREFLGTR